jgi:hypothetical protein
MSYLFETVLQCVSIGRNFFFEKVAVKINNQFVSESLYQLLAQGRWFSPGTPASSTTKTGRHDIAESGVKHQNSNSNSSIVY